VFVGKVALTSSGNSTSITPERRPEYKNHSAFVGKVALTSSGNLTLITPERRAEHKNDSAFVGKVALTSSGKLTSITPEPSPAPSPVLLRSHLFDHSSVCPYTFLERLGDAARRRRHLWRNALETQNITWGELPGRLDPVSIPSKTMSLSWSMGISFMAGLSTVIGAALIFALPGNTVSPTQMAFALSLAAGVMISVTVLEFWLPVLNSKDDGDSLERTIRYTALGAGAFLMLSRLMPHSTTFSTTDIEGGGCDRPLSSPRTVSSVSSFSSPEHVQADHDQPMKGGFSSSTRSWRLALVLMCSLTAHNFPEGFAVAVSSLSSGSHGFAIPIAIAVHNVPEGIAIAVPVMAATGSRQKALLMAFLSGMAEPLGAAVAIFCMNVAGAIASEDSVNNLLCVVGGIMTTVAVSELLPDAWHYGQPIACITGFLVGCVLMLTSLSLGV
jgi:ZIP family zinc transporter